MLLSDADRRRIFGGDEGVAKVNAHLDALVAAAPPLTADQRARLRILLHPASGTPAASAALRPAA